MPCEHVNRLYLQRCDIDCVSTVQEYFELFHAGISLILFSTDPVSGCSALLFSFVIFENNVVIKLFSMHMQNKRKNPNEKTFRLTEFILSSCLFQWLELEHQLCSLLSFGDASQSNFKQLKTRSRLFITFFVFFFFLLLYGLFFFSFFSTQNKKIMYTSL